MMTPLLCASISGNTARHIKNTDFRSTASMLSQSLSVVSRKGFSCRMPALLTSTSTAPHAACTCRTMPLTWLACVTSASITSARPPRASISHWSVTASTGRARWLMTTTAPACAKASAVARPMPVAAPVMRATRPCRLSPNTLAVIAVISASPRRCWPPDFARSMSGRRCWPKTGTHLQYRWRPASGESPALKESRA